MKSELPAGSAGPLDDLFGDDLFGVEMDIRVAGGGREGAGLKSVAGTNGGDYPSEVVPTASPAVRELFQVRRIVKQHR